MSCSAQILLAGQRILGGWGDGQADDQGRFAISGLEPGVYNLLFEHAPGRPHATAFGVEGVRIRAGQSTAALLKVIEGRRVRGIVIDRQTGRPAPEFRSAAMVLPGPGPARRCRASTPGRMERSRSSYLPANSTFT